MSIFILKWRGYCRWQYARATVLLPLAIRTALHGYVLGLAPLRAYAVLARLCARAGALARIRRAGAAMCSGWRPCAHTPPMFRNPILRAQHREDGQRLMSL